MRGSLSFLVTSTNNSLVKLMSGSSRGGFSNTVASLQRAPWILWEFAPFISLLHTQVLCLCTTISSTIRRFWVGALMWSSSLFLNLSVVVLNLCFDRKMTKHYQERFLIKESPNRCSVQPCTYVVCDCLNHSFLRKMTFNILYILQEDHHRWCLWKPLLGALRFTQVSQADLSLWGKRLKLYLQVKTRFPQIRCAWNCSIDATGALQSFRWVTVGLGIF